MRREARGAGEVLLLEGCNNGVGGGAVVNDATDGFTNNNPGVIEEIVIDADIVELGDGPDLVIVELWGWC